VSDRPEYQQEDREALTLRFRVLAQVFVSARELTPMCDLSGCRACELLQQEIAIPPSVASRVHEPREDLEEACENVGTRLLDVTRADDAQACPGGRHVRAFYDRAEQVQREQSA
jgi:hypothetical protein